MKPSFPNVQRRKGRRAIFSGPRRFYVKGQVSRTRQTVSGWKTAAATALLPGALPWFALLFEGVTTVLKAKKRPMPGMC
jgi:hypothetical protein